MAYLRSLFFVALLTGSLSGILQGILHLAVTSPVILQAEQFEKSDAEEVAAWEPPEGFERAAFTLGADLLVAIGFASLLVVGFTLFPHKIGLKEGAVWGLCFFAAFTLAPSFGLPPELPGTEAGPLGIRQIWWLGTAFATLAGLGFIFLWRKVLPILLGFVLLALPHLIGAPSLSHGESTAPLDLQQLFHWLSLLVGGIFWLAMGIGGAYFYQRFILHKAAS